jgi:signal transduction histidine kinase
MAFDRFHRGDGALAQATNGRTKPGRRDGTEAASSGLGLSIVQAIATAHGGYANLTSARGGGTTVRLWIPRGEAQSDNSERKLASRRQEPHSHMVKNP